LNMPIGGVLPSSRVAHTRLIAESMPMAALLKQADHQRRHRLQQFLKQHRAAGQWSVSIAALVDAHAHGTPLGRREIADVILTCGVAGRPDASKRLFYQFTKMANVPRGGEVEEAFFRTCGACGDYESAEDRLQFLLRPSPRRPHLPMDALNHTLDAAAASSLLEGSQAWKRALELFVRLRRDPGTRPSVPLSPATLEKVTRLAELGGRWDACAKLVMVSADAYGCLVPPEAYDAAIRACYRSQRHALVSALLHRCLSARTAPEEVCVRMGLRSAEEVAAHDGLPSLAVSVLSSSHRSQGPEAEEKKMVALPAKLLDAMSTSTSSSASVSSSWVLSLKLFQGLADNGLPLLPQTYEGAIRTCCLEGRWDAAMRVVSEMKRVDKRSCPTHVLRLILLSRAERAPSVEAARAMCEQSTLLNASRRSLDDESGTPGRSGKMGVHYDLPTYLSLLKCAARLQNWRHFHAIHAEMKRYEIPETYDVTKLLILSAVAQQQWASVVLRFGRWMQTSQFERTRLEESAKSSKQHESLLRTHKADFDMDVPLLHAALYACEQVKSHKQKKRKDAIEGEEQTAVSELFQVAVVVERFVTQCLAGDGSQELLESTGGADAASGDSASFPEWLFVDKATDPHA